MIITSLVGIVLVTLTLLDCFNYTMYKRGILNYKNVFIRHYIKLIDKRMNGWYVKTRLPHQTFLSICQAIRMGIGLKVSHGVGQVSIYITVNDIPVRLSYYKQLDICYIIIDETSYDVRSTGAFEYTFGLMLRNHLTY